MRDSAERMAASGVGADAPTLERLLTDRRFNLLGAPRSRVAARGEGDVRWNPEDERCVAAQLVRRAAGQATFASVRALRDRDALSLLRLPCCAPLKSIATINFVLAVRGDAQALT